MNLFNSNCLVNARIIKMPPLSKTAASEFKKKESVGIAE